jgi:CheY-like chemotaxis protein
MKIIIVDDIFINRLLVSEIIRNLGHEVIEAENGRLAVDALQENKGIDMILMDIEMPVMNGIEATRFIRESLAFPLNRVPIIALTAHNPKLFFEDYKDVGFNQLLTKPYSIDKIVSLINEFENQ